MEGIKLIPGIILLVAIAGIIAGATSIVMSKFGDTMDTCYNSSYIPQEGTFVHVENITTVENASVQLAFGYVINSTLSVRNQTQALVPTVQFKPISLIAGTVNVTGNLSDNMTLINVTNPQLQYTYTVYALNGTTKASSCVAPYISVSMGKGNLNLTDEYYTKVVTQEGIGAIAEQTPTVAIIAVMVIIISVIAGVFAYMRFFG